MRFSNIDYTVKYVDPSKGTNGDGSSIVDAMNQLPLTNAEYIENTLYLIRRTDEAVAVTIPNIQCDRKNIIFMGMPLSTDWIYPQVLQLAKDAWSADTAVYANIKSTVANGRFYMPNVLNFHLFRVYLYRNELVPSQYIFYSDNSTYTASVSFQKCKFGSYGINLDSGTYTTQLTTQRAYQFAYFNFIKSWIMQDCLINFISPTSNTFYGFYVYQSQLINVNNVVVNNVFGSASGTNWPFYFDRSSSSITTVAYVENITVNIYKNGAYNYVPSLIYLRTPEVLKVSNITVGIVGTLGTAAPTNLCLYSPMIQFTEARQFEIKNITVNLPQVWYVESSGCALNCESFYYGIRTPGNMQIVKDIYINLEEVSGIDTALGKYYANVKNTSFSNYAAFKFSISSYDNQQTPKPASLSNINVNNVRGVAAYLYGCQIKNSRFHGAVKMQSTVADIELIKSWYPAYGLFITNSTCRVQRFEMNTTNETYPMSEEAVIYNTPGTDNYFVYADYTNVRLRPNTTLTTNTNNAFAVVCGNEVETGHFSHKSPNTIIDTWTVYRENGADVCLKFANNSFDATYPTWIGQEPFGGMKLNATVAGANNLIIYAAYKGFVNTEDFAKKCIIQATITDASGYQHRYFSNVNGSWLDDTSVWNGDTGLTTVKLEMPVNILTLDKQVDVRIMYTYYSAIGFVYIDPAFTLTPTS